MTTERADRRNFIKRGAVATGLVWAVPVVSKSSASAQTPKGSPQPCDCSGQGTALFATGSILGVPLTVGPISQSSDGFEQVASVGGAGEVVSATVLRGGFSPCTAEASVATLDIVLPGLPTISAGVLTSSATGGCDCGSIGTQSSVANLSVGGQQIFDGSAPATLTPIPGVTIVVNDRTCSPSELFARALRISVNILGPLPGDEDDIVLDVVVAESTASNHGCDCP